MCKAMRVPSMLWATLELPGRLLWLRQQGEAIVFPSVWISFPLFCPPHSLFYHLPPLLFPHFRKEP